MTFCEILNNEEFKSQVENIEDLASSLERYPNGDPILEEMLAAAIDRLEAESGYRYKLA